MVNVFYGLANLVRGQVTARVTPKTWWENMENGWVWDLDDFVVNQIGHPYQGSNYYNAGRANGLNFYGSAAMAAFGSATWEFYGETNKASLNDYINTTLGGIAIGEVLHRVAWLVRDPTKSGSGRLWSEIGATALDPVTGYNRFRRGDASRIAEKPAEMVPSVLGGFASAGVLWRGTEHEPFEGSGQAFLETDLFYGDPLQGRSRTPYDAFVMTLRFGGGSPVSEARLAGRLLGEPLGSSGKFQFSVAQAYDFQLNDAYAFGAQSFDAGIAFMHPLSSRVSLALLGSGGLTVLGAIDSLPLGVEEVPEEEEENRSGGQGVSEGPRFYDYGPGSKFTLRALLLRDTVPFVVAFYEGRQLYSLDGLRANHFLQHARLDLRVPIYKIDRLRRRRRVFLAAHLLPGRGPDREAVPLSAVPHLSDMGHFMTRWSLAGVWCALIVLAPAVCAAQADESRLWVVAGASIGDRPRRLPDVRRGLSVSPRSRHPRQYRLPNQRPDGCRSRTLLGAARDGVRHAQHDAHRRGGAVSPLADAGILLQGRRRHGLHPQLGRHAWAGCDQLEGVVGRDRHRLGVPCRQARRL